MKKTILVLSLAAVLAACNQGSGNNAAGAAGNTAGNSSAGLPTPPERPAQQAGQEASMPPGLDCVRNRLSPEQRQALARAAIEQVSRDDPRAQVLLQAVAACGDELSWSQQKRQAATMFLVSAAGAAGIRQELGAQGIQIQELDRTILSDRELMAAAEEGRLTAEIGEAFAMRHREELERLAGGRSLEGELGTRIGNYMGFVALAQITSVRFANES